MVMSSPVSLASLKNRKTKKRNLTSGEIALARSIFKGSINYDLVFVHQRPHNPLAGRNTMTPKGEIYPARGDYRSDYATEDLNGKRLLIHELGHVWQYQNRVIKNLKWCGVKIFIAKAGSYGKAYYYSLEEGKDLLKYGMEQQASIIEDYFALKNLTRTSRLDLYLRRQPDTPTDIDELLSLYEKTALAKFLANPSYAKR